MNNNRTKNSPPPDLRRLLVTGMLEAARNGRWPADAGPDDLRRLCTGSAPARW